MDVTALYTNIPHEAGLDACAHVLDSRPNQVLLHDRRHHLPSAFGVGNQRVYLCHDNQHYLQVCGTAMGTRMAPSYANIFMGVLEKNLLTGLEKSFQ